MVPNFHDTSWLDTLQMLLWQMPAIIAAVTALVIARSQRRVEAKTDSNTDLLHQNAAKVDGVHDLVNGNLKAVANELSELKDTAQKGEKP